MKVTTKSEQPHLRSTETPYTQATIQASPSSRADADQYRRNEELRFLALLVQALNPKVPLTRVNEALRHVIDPEQVFDFSAGDGK